MYKLLLVDDEEIVREGIEHTIQWDHFGFEFVGAFGSGTDALAAVKLTRPDVVITDICMPFGDGLDLAESIAVTFPEIKVILLTGYGEFEYARRALRLGAYDYILKPITGDELRMLLERLRADLDAAAQRAAAEEPRRSSPAQENHPPFPDHPRRGGSYAEHKAHDAVDFIRTHSADPSLRLDTLCAALGVSPSFFCAAFKEHTGKTFVEMLTETRIDRARILLAETDLKNYEIATSVGYSDQHYFSIIFKKIAGVAPSAYRIRSRQESGTAT